MNDLCSLRSVSCRSLGPVIGFLDPPEQQTRCRQPHIRVLLGDCVLRTNSRSAFRRRLEYHASQGRVVQTARRLSKTYQRKIPVVKYGRQVFQYRNQQDCHSPHCKCSAVYRIGRIPHRPLCSQSEGDSSCVGKWAYVPPSQAHDRLDLHAQSLGTIVPHALRETSFISCRSTSMTRPWQPISCTNVGSRVCAGVGAPGGLTTAKRPPCEACRCSGLRHGAVCTESQGERLSLDRQRTPDPVRQQSPQRLQRPGTAQNPRHSR